jgi:hypothetical protein
VSVLTIDKPIVLSDMIAHQLCSVSVSTEAIALEYLKRTRQLIADEANWIDGTGWYGLHDAKFGRVITDVPHGATCFCVMGALFYVSDVSLYYYLGGTVESESFDCALEQCEQSAHALGLTKSYWATGNALQMVNDLIGHSAVLQVLDHAIAQLEAQLQAQLQQCMLPALTGQVAPVLV